MKPLKSRKPTIDVTPHERRLTREELERVRSIDTPGSGVLSVYLDFDPSWMSSLSERRTQADSLLDEAERRYGAQEVGAPHAERMALRANIRAVRALLEDEEVLAPQSARGLAIFCSAPAGVCEALPLPEPADPLVILADRPFIEPLLELASFERWCALLISARASRIFTGTREQLSEVADVMGYAHRRHAQGGWAQANYQRSIDMDVKEHVRGTCTVLSERFKWRPFHGLVVGGHSELHSEVEYELERRSELRGLLAGCFAIDVERATPAEVHDRALPLIETAERSREQEALRRLEEGLAPNGHGAAGLDEVLELLNESRVQLLLVAHGFTAAGFACTKCGWLSASAAPCPVDASTPERRDDIVESAVELALERSGEVMVLRHQLEELATRGSIAALLRY